LFIMDNHSSHQGKKVLDLIKQNPQCESLYMPVSSSPLNPIEKCWAVFKEAWRKYLVINSRLNILETTADLHIHKVLMAVRKQIWQNIALRGSLDQWIAVLDGDVQ